MSVKVASAKLPPSTAGGARDALQSAVNAGCDGSELLSAGLLADDPRLNGPARGAEPLSVSVQQARGALLERVVRGDLIIPDFERFCRDLESIFEDVRSERAGEVARYIPQLSRVEPDSFAMSVCTVDGQRFSLGDDETPFCVQSTCKPINYAIALDRLDVATVHRHVGREPSGRSFNDIALNVLGLPHNPMINAGAIMCASLISPQSSAADRFDEITGVWRALAGGKPIGFDNAVFLSERDTSDRNFALSYFMREKGAFPVGTDLRATLDLYFQCCSISVTARTMSVIAGSFANGGVCPISNERVFKSDTVKNCLSLMASCGMYDFSGEYAFTVGLPAKSGVSGALMIIVPGVCGIATWSPRLDDLGNSVRGVEFSKKLTQRFPFHTFGSVSDNRERADPRRTVTHAALEQAILLCAAAAKGDLIEMRRLVARGADIDKADYDGRTAPPSGGERGSGGGDHLIAIAWCRVASARSVGQHATR